MYRDEEFFVVQIVCHKTSRVHHAMYGFFHNQLKEIQMKDDFASKFDFKPQYRGYVGVERECFLMNDGKIVPAAASILNLLPQDGTYGHELPACQLEMRTKPVRVNDLREELIQVEKLANEAASTLGLSLAYIPVAPKGIPLDVSPDSTGRYARIAEKLPHEVLEAACSVAAVHIHIGVSSQNEIIEVYNRLVNRFDELKRAGDTSEGSRMALYSVMAPVTIPPHYESWEKYSEAMQKRGCIEDPRQCWDLIRISTHGTVEVRVFDSTADIIRIVQWALLVKSIALPSFDFRW